MTVISGFLMSLAVIATALLGIAVIFDMRSPRGRLVEAVASLVGLALAAPLVMSLLRAASAGLASLARTAGWPGGDGPTLSIPVLVAFVLGHATLAVMLLMQRYGAERLRRFAEELDRIRRRERLRVPPVGMEATDDDSRVDADDARTDPRP